MALVKHKVKNQGTEKLYICEELKAIDLIVERTKSKTRFLKPGKEFSQYIKKITRGKKISKAF